MDIPAWFIAQHQHAIAWWNSLGPDGPYYVWLASGAAGLIALVTTWYYVMRKVLGYRKFRGTWYNGQEFEGLLVILDRDQQAGNRVMRHDEIALLRQWKMGSYKGLGFDKRNSYF